MMIDQCLIMRIFRIVKITVNRKRIYFYPPVELCWYNNVIPADEPYSSPFADELTFNACPAVPMASLWSALAPLTIISPCVVVGVGSPPFASKFQ